MVDFKKPKYIRKYDFIRYFNRPKDEWFWPTKTIIDLLSFKSKKNCTTTSDDEETETVEEKEFDTYEFFNEHKHTGIDMDKNDPKIIEGLIIDEKSKKFIKEKYSKCLVYDFDEIFKNNHDFAKQFERTVSLLKENDNIILFQPTFLFKDKAIAKPDAIVKSNGKYIFIETKATTKTKINHLVDVIYQNHIVNYVLDKELDKSISEHYLCLVAYTIAKKNEVPFVLCDTSCFSSADGEKTKLEKYTGTSIPRSIFSNEILQVKQMIKLNSEAGITFSDFICENFEPTSRQAEKTDFIRELLSPTKFEEIVDELDETIINEQPKCLPNLKYKSFIKECEHYPNLREYWRSSNNFPTLKYSGFLFLYPIAIAGYEKGVTYDKIGEWLAEIAKNSKNKALHYYVDMEKQEHKFDLGSFNQETINKMLSLKKRKVYFDFESLNQAIRIVDDLPPFVQIVNQVSVIFDHGSGPGESNNIVIDPTTINGGDFKRIIDSLWPRENQNEYSYIVYNKSFEKARIKEMANYIGEEEYYKKAQTISDNLFDLADLFDPRKKESIKIKDLKGFYSIKKVLPIVEKHHNEIFQKVKCRDYKKLQQVQNGGEAQGLATKRFFRMIGDDEWKTAAENLAIYCENDVRAMIAVEYFLQKIIEQQNR